MGESGQPPTSIESSIEFLHKGSVSLFADEFSGNDGQTRFQQHGTIQSPGQSWQFIDVPRDSPRHHGSQYKNGLIWSSMTWMIWGSTMTSETPICIYHEIAKAGEMFC